MQTPDGNGSRAEAELGDSDPASATGISGARVVIAILGTLAIVAGLVLLAFTAFEPEAAPCASGDAAENAFVNGRFQPRSELFTDVEDAEAFICHDVPELTAEGWALERIAAERTVSLEFLVEGDGIGVVTLGYLEDASGRPLTIDAAPFFGRSYFESLVPAQHTSDGVLVQGRPATVYRYGINPDQVEVIWHDDTLEHRATVMLDDTFTQDDLLEVLQTLE